MVADSASGCLRSAGGSGSLHARPGSALTVYVFGQVAHWDAMASANAPAGLHFPAGALGSIAGVRPGGVWLGGGSSSFSGVRAAGRAEPG